MVWRLNLKIMAAPKVRLNVNVPAPVANALDELAEEKGYSRGDMLKKAVLLLKAVTSAEAKGGRLVILSEEGGKTKETIFYDLD